MKRILSFLSEKRIWTLMISITCFLCSFFAENLIQILLISSSFTFLYISNWVWYTKKTWRLADFNWWNWLADVNFMKTLILVYFNILGMIYLLLFAICLAFVRLEFVPEEQYLQPEKLRSTIIVFALFGIIHILFGQLDFGLPENTSGAKKRIFINSDIFKE